MTSINLFLIISLFILLLVPSKGYPYYYTILKLTITLKKAIPFNRIGFYCMD